MNIINVYKDFTKEFTQTARIIRWGDAQAWTRSKRRRGRARLGGHTIRENSPRGQAARARDIEEDTKSSVRPRERNL